MLMKLKRVILVFLLAAAGRATENDAVRQTPDAGGGSAPQAKAEEKPKFKITPYGRVELDIIYSSRGTNPLDPRQFNGYSTAAGPEKVSSSTFNPRFSVLGLQGDILRGDQQVQTKVEVDFYSTDQANLITPRLRLAYIQYARGQTKVTAGMDWLPVAQLLPDIFDFSIMGYGGNLWQRLPQVTLRQGVGKHWELLGTAMRFERGFTLQPAPFVRDPFTDPVKMPYVGTRIAYQKWGQGESGMLAVSGAYRQFQHPATLRTVKSHLVSAELVVPLTKEFRWSSKVAHGQGLGDEFFRFGQAFNGDSPIRTTTGWTQLSYSAARWSVSGGWGDDDPNNRDLRGISNNFGNYRHNQRVFGNVLYDVFEHVKVGFEYNYLRTNWTNGDLFHAHQLMNVIFYSF
jgi:hypothetical protein